MIDDEARAIEFAQLRRLKIASFAEAATLLLLVCIAVPLKHLGGWEAGVRIMGPVHGVAFLAFVWAAFQTIAGGGWTRIEAMRLFVSACVPFGGFLNAPLIDRKAQALRIAGEGA